ncbi:MAG: aspartate aminotransferase family protein [Phycisphaerales bacterium]|nr:aspartate aminotransferase family protein [Phycisphaerales bacterium]
MNTPTKVSKSAALYERALRVLPGGVSRNTVLRDPHPAYADHGAGCWLTDIEGVKRLDFANNMASLIHGHADPDIVKAVTEQLGRGSAFTMATEVEVEYAELLCGRNPGFEKIRFVNSGTEALMVSLKASRAFTGRAKIAKVEGAYHGGYDYAEVSQAPNPETWGSVDHPKSVPLARGTPASALNDVVVLPYNDIERAIAILDEHADELACVLLDLMPHRVGLRPAEADFVAAIRDWTTRNGALLVLDEVITFRTEYSGLQSRYGITADLTAMGKMIGGGFPIGAVAGRTDVMDVLNPRSKKLLFPHSGTFSANPISITAGLVAMRKFDKAAVDRLNALAKRAMDGIENAIVETGAIACVTGGGAMFRVHMKVQPPRNFREAYLSAEENKKLNILLDHMFDEGFVLINTCTATLSTAMTEVEIDALIAAYKRGFEKLVAMG